MPKLQCLELHKKLYEEPFFTFAVLPIAVLHAGLTQKPSAHPTRTPLSMPDLSASLVLAAVASS